MSETDIQHLKQRRNRIKSQVTRLTLLDKLKDKNDPKFNEISYRLSKIDDTCIEFESIKGEIESVEPESSDQENKCLNFKDKYFAVVVKAKS